MSTTYESLKWAKEELRWNEFLTKTLQEAVHLLGAIRSHIQVSKCIVSRDTREVKIYFTEDFRVYKHAGHGPWIFLGRDGIIDSYHKPELMAEFINAFMRGALYGR